jgi:hypothetical protein
MILEPSHEWAYMARLGRARMNKLRELKLTLLRQGTCGERDI